MAQWCEHLPLTTGSIPAQRHMCVELVLVLRIASLPPSTKKKQKNNTLQILTRPA